MSESITENFSSKCSIRMSFLTNILFHHKLQGKEDHVGPVPRIPKVNNLGKLHIEDLQPDHLEAVKLEQDGHLNKDYKKEIFLGNHEEIEEGNDEERQRKLKDIFYRFVFFILYLYCFDSFDVCRS